MVRRRSIPVLLAALSPILLMASPVGADTHTEAAKAFLESFHERIGGIVSNPDASADVKRAQVARALDENLDYGHLAAAALGQQAEKFSREQFADFAHAYARFLQDFFVGAIASSDNETQRFLDATDDPKSQRVLVRTARKARKGYIPGSMRIPRSSPEGLITTYGLRQRQGEWKFVSIAWGGVDLSTTFRGQFESYLQTNDPDALVAELERRNEAAAGENPFAH